MASLMHRKWLKAGFSILFSVSLLAVLFHWAGTKSLRAIIDNLQPIYLLAAAGIYLTSYILRTIRYYILLDYGRTDGSAPRLPGVPMFGIVCLHNMFNRILPVHSGELTYIVLMKRFLKVETGSGISSLLAARIMDTATVCCYFLVASLAIINQGVSNLRWFIVAGAVSSICMVAFCFGLSFSGARLAALIERRLLKRPNGIVFKLGSFCAKAAADFARLQGRRHILPALCASVGLWGSIYLLFFLLMRAFGTPLDFMKLVWGTTAAIFMYVLPVSGAGGFGLHETGWTAGLLVMGVPQQVGVATGFAVNVYATSLSVFYALIGYLLILLWRQAQLRRKVKADGEEHGLQEGHS